jgi:RsmE family RNA methyltransferase
VNLILLFESDRIEGARFRLTGARARHVREVLKAVPGSVLRVGLLEGPIGSGEIESVGETEVVLGARFEASPPPRPRLDLMLAVPRPKALKRLLPELAAIGVDRLILLRTWRVDRAYLRSPILTPEHYRPLLREGLMQARSTREPEVVFEPRFRPFVEDRSPAMFGDAARWVAHPSATTKLSEMRIAPSDKKVVLAIGPEGGFIEPEIESFERAGFQPVSLGPRILRVETAVIFALAQLDLLREP